jgi:hypothetical protein
VLGHAFLDLAWLLVGVDVQDDSLAVGVAPDLLEPVGGASADGVGGTADPDAGIAQLFELAEVVGDGGLAEPLRAAPAVGAEEDDDLHAGGGCRFDRGVGLWEPEVMELADRGIAGRAELAVGLGVVSADKLRRLALGLGDHGVAPRPEVSARSPASQRPLERMAVSVDEARKNHLVGQALNLAPRETLRATKGHYP